MAGLRGLRDPPRANHIRVLLEPAHTREELQPHCPAGLEQRLSAALLAVVLALGCWGSNGALLMLPLWTRKPEGPLGHKAWRGGQASDCNGMCGGSCDGYGGKELPLVLGGVLRQEFCCRPIQAEAGGVRAPVRRDVCIAILRN